MQRFRYIELRIVKFNKVNPLKRGTAALFLCMLVKLVVSHCLTNKYDLAHFGKNTAISADCFW